MRVTVSKDFQVGTWNHRVIRHMCKAFKRHPMLEIVEMHYDANKSVRGHGSTSLLGDNATELRITAERILRAVKHAHEEPRKYITRCMCDAAKKTKVRAKS